MAIDSLLPITTTTTLSSAKHTPHRRHNHQQQEPEHQQQQQQQQQQRKRKKKQQQQPPPPYPPLTHPKKPPSSWEQFKSLLTCRSRGPSQVHDPSSAPSTRYSSKLGSSCSDICAFNDVVRGNTRVVHQGEHDSASSYCSGSLGPETTLLPHRSSTRSSASRNGARGCNTGGGGYHHSSRGMQLRKLYGCYECHAISEPTRYPVPRTICACPDCGEVFTKLESLELHQIVRHAVTELGPEDSGRNIVEIIFKSSWVKRDLTLGHPVLCKVDRILKVHNTQRTIARFEDYRDTVKSRAALLLLHANNNNAIVGNNRPGGKKNPRCAADGNELLRFYCTTIACSLGARGSTSLCAGASSSASLATAAPPCGVCSIIRHGFGRVQQEQGKGVRTTASSGRAHDCCLAVAAGEEGGGKRRAMLVCRVIAGRVRKLPDVVPVAASLEEEAVGVGYDSLAGGKQGGKAAAAAAAAAGGGGYGGNLEELYVANPRAILPCFVVVYRTLN